MSSTTVAFSPNTLAGKVTHTHPFFAGKFEQVPAYADAQGRAFPERLRWLDREMSDGRPFIAGRDLSVADITGMALFDGAASVIIAAAGGIERKRRASRS